MTVSTVAMSEFIHNRSTAFETTAYWRAAVPWLLAVIVVAAFGARFAPGPWYAALDKPEWTPPDASFGIAWTALYAAMVIVGARLSRAPRSRARTVALTLMAAQLLFNGLWSWLFFGLQWPMIAFVDISLLWLAVVALTIASASVDKPAAIVLVPYVLWLSFAVVLNGCIMMLN